MKDDATIIKDGEEYILKTANEGYWFCTCGTFFKNTDKHPWRISCPHCNSNKHHGHYGYYGYYSICYNNNFTRQKILKYENYAFHVEENSFEINMPDEEMDLDELKETLTEQLNTTTTTEIDYDFFRTEDPFKVTINGKPVKSKTEKLKSLKNLEIKSDKSLFRAAAMMLGCTSSMRKVIQTLMNKPKIEVFYSTYGIRHIYTFFDIKDMDLTRRKPHQILGVTKNMLKKLIDAEYNVHYSWYKDARKLAIKYVKKPDIADYSGSVVKTKI